jgi:hypothetical protein
MIDMREGNCALCGHDEVIVSRPQEFFGSFGQEAHPMAVSHGTSKSFFGGTIPNKDSSFGELSVCVCRRCGFVQWFASRPLSIPIDDVDTKLVKGRSSESPYR